MPQNWTIPLIFCSLSLCVGSECVSAHFCFHPFRIAVFSVTVFYDERIVIVAEQRPDASEEDSFQWMSRVLQVIFFLTYDGIYLGEFLLDHRSFLLCNPVCFNDSTTLHFLIIYKILCSFFINLIYLSPDIFFFSPGHWQYPPGRPVLPRARPCQHPS